MRHSLKNTPSPSPLRPPFLLTTSLLSYDLPSPLRPPPLPYDFLTSSPPRLAPKLEILFVNLYIFLSSPSLPSFPFLPISLSRTRHPSILPSLYFFSLLLPLFTPISPVYFTFIYSPCSFLFSSFSFLIISCTLPLSILPSLTFPFPPFFPFPSYFSHTLH